MKATESRVRLLMKLIEVEGYSIQHVERALTRRVGLAHPRVQTSTEGWLKSLELHEASRMIDMLKE